MKAKKSTLTSQNLAENDWKIWGIPLCSRGKVQVLKWVEKNLALKRKNLWIATVNPEFVMKATKNEDFLNILKKTDLNVVDGIGLLWAKEVIGSKRKLFDAWEAGRDVLRGKYKDALVPGSDLVNDISQIAANNNYKVFYLGGFGDRAERTAEHFKSEFLMSDEQIKYSQGEPKLSNEEVVKEINEFKPDVLFVAYGMKKQEEWIQKNRQKLNVGLMIGVGRSFDYYSGDLKRAPKVWRKMGLEWFYSLIKEPKRFKRQLELPKFIWKVLSS